MLTLSALYFLGFYLLFRHLDRKAKAAQAAREAAFLRRGFDA